MMRLLRFAAIGVVAAVASTAFAGEAATNAGEDMAQVFQLLDEASRDGAVLLAQTEAAPGVNGNLLIEPGEEGPIKFDVKLDLPDTPMDGRSIEELIVGTPLFPPIEGLDKSIWEKKPCGTCHQWTKERLCVQAKTYIGAEHMVGRLEHPYGLPFKQALERWGEAGCP